MVHANPYKIISILFLLLAGFSGLTNTFAQEQGFESAEIWHDLFCYQQEVCLVGDFNGDGRDDIIAFTRSTTHSGRDGDVWVALSTGSRFGKSSMWHDNFCYRQEICKVADVNGDGRDDIIAFTRSTTHSGRDGDVWVALSTGSRFGKSSVWHDNFCYRQELCELGDVNGDESADILAFVPVILNNPNDGNVWVALSTGSSFGESAVWHESFCYSGEICAVGDVTGDQRADIIVYGEDVGVAPSTGSSFEPALLLWGEGLCVANQDMCMTGDMNNDDIDDAVIITPAGESVTYLSSGTSFGEIFSTTSEFCLSQMACTVGDVNGDGSDDLVGFIGSTLRNSSEGDVKVALTNPLAVTAQQEAQPTNTAFPTSTFMPTQVIPTTTPTTPPVTTSEQMKIIDEFFIGYLDPNSFDCSFFPSGVLTFEAQAGDYFEAFVSCEEASYCLVEVVSSDFSHYIRSYGTLDDSDQLTETIPESGSYILQVVGSGDRDQFSGGCYGSSYSGTFMLWR